MSFTKNCWELTLTKPFSSISLWVSIFLLSLAAGISISISINNWEWFGRSGSIATISGLLLIMRPLLRKGSVELARVGMFAESTNDSDGALVEDIDSQDINDGRASLLGMLFTIVGTIVWGFGDLI